MRRSGTKNGKEIYILGARKKIFARTSDFARTVE
jgi:hypothetical protein